MKFELNKLWRQAENLPKLDIRTSVLILSLPCLLIIFQNTNFDEKIMGPYFFPFGLFILCLLVGWKHLKPYHRKIDNIKKTIIIGATILICQWLICIALNTLGIVGDDPQGIQNVVYSTKQTMYHLLKLPFIASGEEYYVWLLVIGALSMISLPIKYRVIVVILLVSFIFGYHHVISYQKLTALLPLAASEIPSIAFSIYYRSILPAILAHFLFDLTSFMAHWGVNGTVYTYLAVTVCVLLIVFLKPHKRR